MSDVLCVNNNSFVHLMRSAQAGRIVHALNFCGPAGTGKKDASILLAQKLLCRETSSPCGKCDACKRTASGLHPDVRILSPEKNGKSIGIDAVRELSEYLSVRPFEGGNRVIIIEHADLLTEAAQNGILKTLEETSSFDYFILLSEHRSTLLPTIRSRVRMVRFYPLETKECAKWLADSGVPFEKAYLASAIAKGAPGRAAELSRTDLTCWTKAQSVLRYLYAGDITRAVNTFPSDDRERADVLACLEMWGRDRLLLDNQAEELTYYAHSNESIRIDGEMMLFALNELSNKINANMTWQNALESVFLRLSEDRPTWQL